MNTVRVLLLRMIAHQGLRVDSPWVGAVLEFTGLLEVSKPQRNRAGVGLGTENPHTWAAPLPIAFGSGFLKLRSMG